MLLGVIEGVRELPVNVFLQLTKYLATLLMGAGILEVNSSGAVSKSVPAIGLITHPAIPAYDTVRAFDRRR